MLACLLHGCCCLCHLEHGTFNVLLMQHIGMLVWLGQTFHDLGISVYRICTS